MKKTKKETQKQKEMKEYNRIVSERAKNFKLKPVDVHNLFDLFFMIETPPEIQINLIETLKLSNMDKWFYNFHKKLEKLVEDKKEHEKKY